MLNAILNNQEKILQLIQKLYATIEFQRIIDEISKESRLNIARYNVKEFMEIKINNQITQLLILTYLNTGVEILLLNEFNKKQIIIFKNVS